MWPVALRPLLVLIAVLGALTAPDAGSARGDVVRGVAAPSATPGDDFGCDPLHGWLGLAVLNEPTPVSLAGIETSSSGSGSADEDCDDLPRPKRGEPARATQQRRAFAPGELPPALAFLRLNGSANAGGTGT